MRYILIIFSIFIVGCNNHSENKNEKENLNQKVITSQKPPKIESKKKKDIIKIEDLVFEKINEKIKFNFQNRKILLFSNGGNLSKSQIDELKKGGYKFYVIKNNELITFFKIHKFPTIIITNGKKEKRYEGFIPNEVLKYEIKD